MFYVSVGLGVLGCAQPLEMFYDRRPRMVLWEASDMTTPRVCPVCFTYVVQHGCIQHGLLARQECEDALFKEGKCVRVCLTTLYVSTMTQ